MCCCGAWGDPGTEGREGVFYPQLFLDRGVQYFIGAWMDVVTRSAADGRWDAIDVDRVGKLASMFFADWAVHPKGAPTHLYRAKAACDFHPVTSLYQIYTAVAPDVVDGQPLVTALASGLADGDRLGDYVLGREVWSDPYARTFRANHVSHGSNHLIQVLVDEWQDLPEIGRDVQSAVQLLNNAPLAEGHLVPARHEHVMLTRGGEVHRRLHIVV
jgi:hypothetical protein